MTVKHTATGKVYNLTADAWQKIKARGKGDAYAVVDFPPPPRPKEVKMSGKQKPESEIDGTNTDGLPGKDARQDQ